MPIVEFRMPEEANEGTEASLGQWLKQPGEAVQEHEPLVEIATDKVTIEVPSPVTGVLAKLLIRAGSQVHPGDLLGLIDTASAVEAAAAPAEGLSQALSSEAPLSPRSDAEGTYSPAVRRLLKQHGLNPLQVPRRGGTARITIEDVEAFLAAGPTAGGVSLQFQDGAQASAQASNQSPSKSGRLVPHTPMRKSIAAHMARSVQTAPHVTSVFEADLSAVLADRTRRKAASTDAVPSVTAYLIKAAVEAIRKFPEVNSKWQDAHLEVFDWVNFGVGTALESGGLVVPVLRDAHTMDLLTISDRLRELTAKARSGKLTQADMQDGTFTLSNHGVSGSLLAAPIILPHGQAAILGAGKMQKRVIVCETGGRELFRVRPMMYVTLTVDHRVLDGQQTNGFLTAFVEALENPEQFKG